MGEQKTTRMHQNLVLQDVRSALPQRSKGSFTPLLKLVNRWLENGILHAASTLRAQQQLQEATSSSRSEAPVLFRKACWHAALNSLLHIQPGLGDPETLSQAVCEHWRKRHGICIKF